MATWSRPRPGRPPGLRLGLLALCASCGGGAAAPDAGADARAIPCEVPQGRAFVIDEARGDPTYGYDLDGDGEIDNAITKLPAQTLGDINGALEGSIESGFVLILPLFVDPAGGAPAEGHFFIGVDADGEGSDTFTGHGEFLVYRSLFDPDCRSRAKVDQITPREDESGDLVGYSIRTDHWNVSLPIGAGSFVFTDPRIEITFEDGGFSGDLGGVLDACTLNSLPYSYGTASTLERVIDTGLQPDIDVDGDGLETLELSPDGLEVVRCIDGSDGDGDGEPDVFDDPMCPCFPQIADGYSVGMSMHAVSAEIVGVL